MADAPPPFDPSKPFTTEAPKFDPSKPFTAGSGAAAAKPATWVNDAGQTIDTATGQPVKETDSSYTGSILPFRRDESGLHLAVPEAIAAPVRGAVEGGQRASGAGQAGADPLRPLSPDTLSTLGSLVGSPVAGMADRGMLGASTLVPGGRLAPKTEDMVPSLGANQDRNQALVENRARSVISQRHAESVRGGAPTAVEIMEEMARGKKEGQPLTLSDVPSTGIKDVAGSAYRQGGAVKDLMKQFYLDRSAGATSRVEGLINKHLSDDSLAATTRELIEARSEHARPLFDKVAEGGSTAPLINQFEKEMQAANQAVVDAQRDMINTGNIRGLEAAKKTQDEVLQRLSRARADGTIDAPGAIWSPRLQELLDQPEVQQGLRAGLANERRTAVGKGRPYNPTEYAIVGTTKDGEPIVGSVPTMRVLMVAKEGLDGIIADAVHATTGRPTKAGLSFIHLRDGLVNELDRLNPLYKAARDQWGGDTESIMAAKRGYNFLKETEFPSQEELADYFGKLSDNQKQFFITGVANRMKRALYKKADSVDKGSVINNEEVRRMIRPLFKNEADTDAFLEGMERESTMKRTANEVMSGSQTAERLAADKKYDTVMHAAATIAHGVGHILSGNYLASTLSAVRLRRLLGQGVDPAINEAIARAVTNPDIELSQFGDILPPVPVPPKPRTQSPMPKLAPQQAVPGAVVGDDKKKSMFYTSPEHSALGIQ